MYKVRLNTYSVDIPRFGLAFPEHHVFGFE